MFLGGIEPLHPNKRSQKVNVSLKNERWSIQPYKHSISAYSAAIEIQNNPTLHTAMKLCYY
jgi:hypothetical protein